MAEHQVMSWLSKHHSYKRDLVSHPNDRVDAAGDNCATDKLSMTSPLVPLASNELFGMPCGQIISSVFQLFTSRPEALIYSQHLNKYGKNPKRGDRTKVEGRRIGSGL